MSFMIGELCVSVSLSLLSDSYLSCVPKEGAKFRKFSDSFLGFGEKYRKGYAGAFLQGGKRGRDALEICINKFLKIRI